jgi:predicted dehydrogenase
MEINRREFVKLAGVAAGGAISAAGFPAEPWKPSRTYRACIIGHTGRGGYGHGLDLAFQKIPGVTVVAVADPVERRRRDVARKTGAARTYGDWREMLEREKPDLVSIGPRWVENRLEMVSRAAEVGAHIYMEKPLAVSLEEADAMLSTAEKHGIRIALAHQVRVAPSLLHLKKLVEEGLIGDLLEIRTRGKQDRRAGGEDMMVLGWHCSYLMRFFGGKPLWCSAWVQEKGRDITAADRRAASEPLGPVAGDCIHSCYAFPGGLQGHFASQKRGRGKAGRFQITLYGSGGVATVHIGQDPEIYYLPDPLWSPGKSGARWRPLPDAPSNGEPSGLRGAAASNKRLVEDLIRAVETGGQSVASGYEGRLTLEMIHAVYASHLRGARVTFPLEDRRHPLGTL